MQIKFAMSAYFFNNVQDAQNETSDLTIIYVLQLNLEVIFYRKQIQRFIQLIKHTLSSQISKSNELIFSKS